MHGEVDLGEVVDAELDYLLAELLVGFGLTVRLFGGQTLGQAATAVLASAAALASLGEAFGG